MNNKKEKFIIIDGNALIHRAWHALPPTLTTKTGEIVNAVYGFTMILLKVLNDLKPDYLAVTFDLKAPTFRHKQYNEYKATRVKQADELYAQIPRIKQVVKAFNIPIYEMAGFEADDVIATLVKDKQVKNLQSIIVTGDLDTLQLVNDQTEIFTMHKGISDTLTYNEIEVKRRFDGLMPSQMVDYKALRGDPSDNIPGVKGIGEKGAITLLKEFKTLDNLYKNLSSKKISDRYRNLLTEQKDQAIMSKQLSQLVFDVPIKFKLEEAKVTGYDINQILPLFAELEFKSLMNKLPKEGKKGKAAAQDSFDFSQTQPRAKNTGTAHYTLIKTEADFNQFLTELGKQEIFVLDTETSGLNPLSDELLGISFCWQEGNAFYLPASTRVERGEPASTRVERGEPASTRVERGEPASTRVERGEPSKKSWLEQIKPILADEKVKKVGHNIKFDLQTLQTAGLTVNNVAFDTMVASYLINPGSRQHNLDGLVFTELGYQMQPITDLIGRGKTQITLREVPLERVADYSCEDADFTWRLIKPLTKELAEKNNLGLMQKIEVPLIPVLAEIEKNGVLIDTPLLKKIAGKVDKELIELEKNIHQLAGTKFNIASPLQLKEILFEKLQISSLGLGRTKTGISTAADELEKLKGKHKIIDLIIRFRELAKLKSTYLDALPKLVDLSGRIHTSFNQTVTATGRLSSSEPNLQNIPIRTELGQQIRKAFIAPKGFKIISADYSQIELRIIASLANDEKMIESFKKGEDIHQRTAAEINNVPLEKVTKGMRYAAKAVNFGIIYGQGPFGLAASTGISRGQAHDFIDKYFEIHHNIFDYLEATKELAKKTGYVETFFGRRRYLPEINSTIQPIAAAAERMAINHPIQGTAADLIKLAMIEIYQKLPKISPESKMILQVHDELVFEVPAAEVKKVAAFVKTEMEKVYQLRAPVEAEVEAGDNWGDLKEIA
ncbi:MAG: DNA polymerase I [Patescibacteria group bacterium]|jgi:DNA polymerase-1